MLGDYLILHGECENVFHNVFMIVSSYGRSNYFFSFGFDIRYKIFTVPTSTLFERIFQCHEWTKDPQIVLYHIGNMILQYDIADARLFGVCGRRGRGRGYKQTLVFLKAIERRNFGSLPLFILFVS